MSSKCSRFSCWNVAWSSWVAGFVVIETLALRSKNQKATLSAHTRSVFGFDQKVARQVVGKQAVGMAAWLWVLVHLLNSPGVKS